MSNVLYDVPGPRARRRSLVISIVVIVAVLALIGWLVVQFVSPRVTAIGSTQPPLSDPSRWDIFLDRAVWRDIGGGLLGTLRMAGAGAVGAIVIGVLFSFLRTARTAWIRVPSTVVLEFFRGMPVLLMMLFILLVFSTEAYWAGVWALAVYNGAIIGEILRAGVAGLPRGQREAGLTIGLSPLATRFRIEFPQAVRNMLPIIIAQLVVLLKDTALAYVIAYDELLDTMLRGMRAYYGDRYMFSLFLVCLVIYLAMNLLLSTIARLVARRVRPGAGNARVPRRGRVFDDALAKAQSDQSLQAGGGAIP